MVKVAIREPHPLVRWVRRRTVAKVLWGPFAQYGMGAEDMGA